MSSLHRHPDVAVCVSVCVYTAQWRQVSYGDVACKQRVSLSGIRRARSVTVTRAPSARAHLKMASK